MRPFAFVVALLLPGAALAQSEVVWGTFAGATAGSLSRVGASAEARNGATVGATWSMQYSPHLAFELAASWVQKGGRVVTPSRSADLSLEYFEMPISIRISDPMVGDGQRAFLRLGMAIANENRCSAHSIDVMSPLLVRDFVPSPPASCNSLRYKLTDIGPLAGIGVVIRSGRSRITFELRRTEGSRLEPSGSDYKMRAGTTAFLAGLGWTTP